MLKQHNAQPIMVTAMSDAARTLPIDRFPARHQVYSPPAKCHSGLIDERNELPYRLYVLERDWHA